MTWRGILPALLAASLLFATQASADPASRRYTNDQEAERWSGVGLLDLGGGNCTGVLIGPDLVLTAAHCVVDERQWRVYDASRVSFRVGWRDGRSIERRQATSIEIHPGYLADRSAYNEARVRTDVAKIRLDKAVKGAPSYGIASTPRVRSNVALLSYSQGRLSRLSIQSPCQITSRRTEFLEFDCRSAPGASGAPVFQIAADGTPSVVALNTGTRLRGSARSALGLTLDHVRGFIGSTRTVSPAAPTGGSVFSRPGISRLPGGSRPGDGLKRLSR